MMGTLSQYGLCILLRIITFISRNMLPTIASCLLFDYCKLFLISELCVCSLVLYFAVYLYTIGQDMTSALVAVATVVMATSWAQPPHQPEHFKLGFLAPWNASFDDFSALTSASAISIALERVHSDPTLNKSMRFRSVIIGICYFVNNNNNHHKFSGQSGDDRKITFSFHQLSILIQRFNAILLLDSFVKEEEE